MKKSIMCVLLCGFVLMLTGCGSSGQEKVAEEQLKAIEQQKAMIEGFRQLAKGN